MDSELKEEKKIKQEVGNLIDKARIINFSDAVFAFAATLLVLKIDIPEIDAAQVSTQLGTVILTLWPQYLANIISFLVIGYYWLSHHAIFGMLKRYDSPLVWMNLVFLIFVSFIPFPVDLYGDYMNVPVVVVFYTTSLALVGYMLAIIWAYASHNYRLVSNELGEKQVHYYLARSLVAPVVFTLSIPLVYIHPLLAQLSWLFVILGVVVVNKIYKRKKISEIEKTSL